MSFRLLLGIEAFLLRKLRDKKRKNKSNKVYLETKPTAETNSRGGHTHLQILLIIFQKLVTWDTSDEPCTI